MNKQLTNQGYTLIELLLYVAIVGTLLTAVSSFFTTSLEARIKNQSITEVNQQGNEIMERIVATIRNATSVTAPIVGASSNTSLTLAVPNGLLSPTIFGLSGTTIRVQEGGNPAVNLNNNLVQITDLTFRNLSRPSTPGVIQVTFKVSRVNTAGRNAYDYEQTFTSTAALRWP